MCRALRISGFLRIVMLGLFANSTFNPAEPNGLLYGNPSFFMKQLVAMLLRWWGIRLHLRHVRIIDMFTPMKVHRNERRNRNTSPSTANTMLTDSSKSRTYLTAGTVRIVERLEDLEEEGELVGPKVTMPGPLDLHRLFGRSMSDRVMLVSRPCLAEDNLPATATA